MFHLLLEAGLLVPLRKVRRRVERRAGGFLDILEDDLLGRRASELFEYMLKGNTLRYNDGVLRRLHFLVSNETLQIFLLLRAVKAISGDH